MKNKLKGFTLVECLIALAILGLATMTMAQIYGGVAKVNKNNNEINTSISNQMKYVEKQIDDGGVINLKFGNSDDVDPELETDDDGNYTGSQRPPHQYIPNNGGTASYILLTEIERDAAGNITYGNKFSYPVDVNVLKIRDREDNYKGETDFDNNYEAVGDGSVSSNAGTGPKYKYFTAH